MSEALRAGISRYMFYRARDEGLIEPVARGIYRLSDLPPDCFKFRNRMGMEVVLEALKLYRKRQAPQFNKVLEYARVCRVEKVIRPYLEAVL